MTTTPSGWAPLHPTLQNLPVAYVEVDAQGILRAANQFACRMHNMPEEELIGHSVWEFVPDDEVGADRVEFTRALETGEDPPMIRRSLFSIKGGYRAHEIHRRVLRDAEGKPIGFSAITFDVSELENAHREVQRAKCWLESAIHSIPQAVILTDALGFVRFINPAAERLIEWPAAELVGLQIEKGMPVLRAVSRAGNLPLSFRITLHEPWNGDVEILTRSRQTVSVWLSASPILDSREGWTTGVVIVLGSPRIITPPELTAALDDKA